MEKHEFERVDPLVDSIAEEVDGLIEGDALANIKTKLEEISGVLGDSVTLDINLNVFDTGRKKVLPLLQTGLASDEGSASRQHWADSSPQRYIVDGEMSIVPHDYCPSCWAVWDFKDQHPVCLDCGVRLGNQVKLLIDDDQCPSCNEGTVTATDPTCARCGCRVDPTITAWG